MVKLWEPKYSNCVFWGVYAKIVYGAELQIVVSKNWNVPLGGWHLICKFNNGETRSYKPIKSNPLTKWYEALVTIMFKGEVVDEFGERNRKITK